MFFVSYFDIGDNVLIQQQKMLTKVLNRMMTNIQQADKKHKIVIKINQCLKKASLNTAQGVLHREVVNYKNRA